MNKEKYRLDRNSFNAYTVSDADKAFNDYRSTSIIKRLEIAHYLNNVAFNFPIDSPPKLDRTAFQAFKQE